jgi:micrococcal nuclease
MGFGKRLLMFLLIIILLGLLSVYWPKLSGNVIYNNLKADYSKENAYVTKIVDGDTIHVKINGNEKDEIIRFLGINTPEKGKEYYKEAKDFLIKNIENNSIEILRDITDKDQYGRKLRYVFYDNRLINVEILENGLATSFMLDNLVYEEKLRNAENFAENNNIGLWIKSSSNCAECIKLKEINAEIDFFVLGNDCSFNCNLNGWIAKDDANHFFKINNLNAMESEKYDSIIIFKKEVWNDNGDRFFLRDEKGKLVVFYEY